MRHSFIQSVVFDINYWSIIKARRWLNNHNLVPIKKVNKINNNIRYRIIEPNKFERFSTIVLPNNIHLIIGYT